MPQRINERRHVLGLSLAVIASLVPFADAQAAEWIGPGEGERFESRDLEALLRANPLPSKENLRALPLAKSEQSHFLLVQVRDREPLHLHADSEITVFLLEGRGEIRVGEQQLPVKAGDAIHIPRGTIHAFINGGRKPAAALVVYSPAPGPDDRVLIRE
jgi:mannose-6-phosphate isomerase-like protein (cupin superfamily)